MFALCCRQKLLARLKAKPATEHLVPDDSLGDWYANLVILRRRHLVVGVSERTLLPVVVEPRPRLSTIGFDQASAIFFTAWGSTRTPSPPSWPPWRTL